MRRPLIVAIHGILTRQTRVSWPDRFAAFVQDGGEFIVEKKEYEAGPLPMWNVWVANRRHARALVASIEPFLPRRISFVAHSNGCDVALKAMKLLAEMGVPTHAFVATGAAIEADVEKNGVLELIDKGMLGRAVAYCALGDAAVKHRVIWPYGHLGCTGWKASGRPPLDARIVTRWFPGFGHGTYFHRDHIQKTFNLLLEDAA